MPQSFFSNTVTEDDILPGDHLYCWSSILHHHHGIYIGGADKSIIHVYGDQKLLSEVQQVKLEEFTRGGRIKRACYNRPTWELFVKAPGTVFNFPSDPPHMVIQRAQTALGESPTLSPELQHLKVAKPWRYSLLFKNCETFCLQCTAPKVHHGSHQAKMFLLNPFATIASGVRTRLGEWMR